jgi:peptide deformylase
MSARKVLIDPDKGLREVSVDVSIDEIPGSRIQSLIADLIETMKVENGIGIAAPQIGVKERVIIVDAGSEIKAFINPRIISRSFRKVEFEEGCLSVPGVFGMVKRSREVRVEAYDINGSKITIKASDLMADVLQHEIDHLDGILFIDKVTKYSNHSKM